MIGNWKKIREKNLFKRFRKVDSWVFESPDGREVDFDIKVEANPVCVLAITKDNKVVLAEQFRQGPEMILKELPGGGSEPDEEKIDAIKREFLEETGYTGKFQFVGNSFVCAYSTSQKYNFVATECEKIREPNLDDNEFVNVVEMDLEDFREHLRTGKLTDVATAYLGLDFLGLL